MYLAKVLKLMASFEHHLPPWLEEYIVIPHRPASLMSKVVRLRDQFENKE